MIIVTTTFVRKNTDVKYYLENNLELKENFSEFIKKHLGILILHTETISISDLEQITTTIFDSKDSLLNFLNLIEESFPGFMKNRDEYCNKNNIEIIRNENNF